MCRFANKLKTIWDDDQWCPIANHRHQLEVMVQAKFGNTKWHSELLETENDFSLCRFCRKRFFFFLSFHATIEKKRRKRRTLILKSLSGVSFCGLRCYGLKVSWVWHQLTVLCVYDVIWIRLEFFRPWNDMTDYFGHERCSSFNWNHNLINAFSVA